MSLQRILAKYWHSVREDAYRQPLDAQNRCGLVQYHAVLAPFSPGLLCVLVPNVGLRAASVLGRGVLGESWIWCGAKRYS